MEEIIRYNKSKFISRSHFLIITSISYSLERLDAFILVGNNSREDCNESELDGHNDLTGVECLFLNGGIVNGEISFNSIGRGNSRGNTRTIHLIKNMGELLFHAIIASLASVEFFFKLSDFSFWGWHTDIDFDEVSLSP